MSDDPRIAELEAEGYTVVRRRTYENLRREKDIAQQMYAMEREYCERTRQWGVDAHKEIRRLTERIEHIAVVASGFGMDLHEFFGAVNDRTDP